MSGSKPSGSGGGGRILIEIPANGSLSLNQNNIKAFGGSVPNACLTGGAGTIVYQFLQPDGSVSRQLQVGDWASDVFSLWKIYLAMLVREFLQVSNNGFRQQLATQLPNINYNMNVTSVVVGSFAVGAAYLLNISMTNISAPSVLPLGLSVTGSGILIASSSAANTSTSGLVVQAGSVVLAKVQNCLTCGRCTGASLLMCSVFLRPRAWKLWTSPTSTSRAIASIRMQPPSFLPPVSYSCSLTVRSLISVRPLPRFSWRHSPASVIIAGTINSAPPQSSQPFVAIASSGLVTVPEGATIYGYAILVEAQYVAALLLS